MAATSLMFVYCSICLIYFLFMWCHCDSSSVWSFNNKKYQYRLTCIYMICLMSFSLRLFSRRDEFLDTCRPQEQTLAHTHTRVCASGETLICQSFWHLLIKHANYSSNHTHTQLHSVYSTCDDTQTEICSSVEFNNIDIIASLIIQACQDSVLPDRQNSG